MYEKSCRRKELKDCPYREKRTVMFCDGQIPFKFSLCHSIVCAWAIEKEFKKINKNLNILQKTEDTK